jgi:hypothetical protein
MAAATVVEQFRNGLMYATSAVYFGRLVGLSPAHVGIGRTCAGFAGMASGYPVGILDRLLRRRQDGAGPATGWAERTGRLHASLMSDPPVSAIPTLD